MLANKLRLEAAGGLEGRSQKLAAYIESLRQSPAAVATEKANDQHYELPPGFFQKVLG